MPESENQLPFPVPTYERHGKWSQVNPHTMPGAKTRLLSSDVCLPSEESGDYRRYTVRNNNEGFIYAQHGGMDSYSLGAVACPTILKCSNCPLRK